jgi:HAD superfamily hydrolase (TIGR01509 family)
MDLNRFQAVIWDCDGVLIDSETLACQAAVDMLAACGCTIPLGDYLARFMGKSDTQMFAELRAETGKDFAARFDAEGLRLRQEKLFRDQLKAIPGIKGVLDGLSLPRAVASGSPKARLDLTLGLSGLTGYFGEHIYSAEMVAKGKPAPDVFLLAAEKLGVDPAQCLAVEDSPNGLKAAKAAGMTVWAFTGGSHMTPALRENLLAGKPDLVLNHMWEWPASRIAA